MLSASQWVDYIHDAIPRGLTVRIVPYDGYSVIGYGEQHDPVWAYGTVDGGQLGIDYIVWPGWGDGMENWTDTMILDVVQQTVEGDGFIEIVPVQESPFNVYLE
ncbi:hypothetical protein [Halomarina oriensis]|uniref:Uncharacterized protein n=1 Tax=Halomarina oriensis TaxID=671145 RepID=A0A6B0GP29_9EURY|nr:hypothetical protein [Halomarina oriensis]MWG36686.1 hypothetical protein [Halomarina oriensis]